MSNKWENNEEIQIFREYLRIPSVHPNVDYEPCVKFLKKQAADLGLPCQVFHPAKPDKPVVVLTWKGTQPDLPAILLNSHMDVVPVFPENWTHPPFGADMDEEGRIFARGAQDMKCVGMQYLAAIRALKKEGVTLKRTIHISYVPEEEIGGYLGMADFVETEDFKKLNIGFALDEGLASPTEEYPVYYAERNIWQIMFRINGTAGHGSLLHENTVGEKFQYILNKIMAFREGEVKRLKENPNMTVGDVTTVNLTILKGGVQANVVPPTLEATFDMRLSRDLDQDAYLKQLHAWCKEAGPDVELIFTRKQPRRPATIIDDSNHYWVAFRTTMKKLDLKFRTLIFPGGTDSRYLHEKNIPCIGFSPMNKTTVLLHDHDEYLKAETYLEGVQIYNNLLKAIGNV